MRDDDVCVCLACVRVCVCVACVRVCVCLFDVTLYYRPLVCNLIDHHLLIFEAAVINNRWRIRSEVVAQVVRGRGSCCRRGGEKCLSSPVTPAEKDAEPYEWKEVACEVVSDQVTAVLTLTDQAADWPLSCDITLSFHVVLRTSSSSQWCMLITPVTWPWTRQSMFLQQRLVRLLYCSTIQYIIYCRIL